MGAVRLALRHPRGSTTLAIGTGALDDTRSELGGWVEDRTVFVVSDDHVQGLHGARLEAALAPARSVVRLLVPRGEAAKSPAEAQRLWRAMLEAGGKRDSRVVAFGGGSVGDLAGFVAGAFLRGVSFAQVPTTLLAQVDAAIGGKTGVDLPEGKNTVGLFHHPDLVIAEAEFLPTLPVRELRAGLVEAVKVAFLLDPGLFATIERDLPRLLAGDPAALGPVVAGAARAKVGVVERDPEERGERQLLNFGHTLGHAVETACGYRGPLHGEAVAWGMRFALRLAASRGLPADDARRLERVLAAIDPPPLPRLDPSRMVTLMQRDKKAREDGLAWVLPRRLGEGAWGVRVSPEEVSAALAAFLAGD